MSNTTATANNTTTTINMSPTTTTTEQETHYTFYSQPWLFYPRRIHSYLTFKPLPSSILSTFVNVSFTRSGEMTKHPGKPEGSSIPVLRFGPASGDVIRQSVATLNYLEDKHPRGGWDMRGSTALERARVDEVIGITEDASQAFGFWAAQSTALYAPKVAQSIEAASFGRERLGKCLHTLQDYAVGNGVDEGKWIAGTEKASIADCVLASLIEYARDFYGKDLCLEFDLKILEGWMRKWESTEAGERGGEKTPPEELGKLAREWKW